MIVDWNFGLHNASTEEAWWCLFSGLALLFSLQVLRLCYSLLAIFRGNIANGWRKSYAAWMFVAGLAPCATHLGFLLVGLTHLLFIPPAIVPEIRASARPTVLLFIVMEAGLAVGTFALYRALNAIIYRPHEARDTQRDADRDKDRDAERDPHRDMGRDLGRDEVRDPARDQARDQELTELSVQTQDIKRDMKRDTARDAGRDRGRDQVRDPARDAARDEEVDR